MKNVDFRASTRKLTFFSSVKSGQILELACGYSYAEKSEKNIGAKIVAIVNAQKTVKDRVLRI